MKLGNIKPKLNKITNPVSPKKNNIFNNRNKLTKKMDKKLDNKKIMVNCTERNSFSKKIKLPNIEVDYSRINNNHDTIGFDDFDNDNNINYNTCNVENNVFKTIKKIPVKRKINSKRNNLDDNKISSSNKIKNPKSKEDTIIVKQSKIQIMKKIKTIDGNISEKKQILDANSENINEDSYKSMNTDNFNEIENNHQISLDKSDEIQNNNDNNFDFVIINNDCINETEDKNQYDFIIPEKYENNNYELLNTIESDGKKINIFTNNKKEILFPSGVKKEVFGDGYQLVFFPNGDKKQNFPEGKTIYYFNDAKTVQTSFSDGLNIFKFSNNQIEKHYPDGSKFIIFPNGTKRKIAKDGTEENYLSDEDMQINTRNKTEDIPEELNKLDNKQLFMSYKSIDDNEDY